MESLGTLRKELIGVGGELLQLLDGLKSIPDVEPGAFRKWEALCTAVEKQLNEEVIRVAVVGAIKSGKSTLVNALFKGDYVKRGAGVVTSIVTRIRAGRRLRARLFFKTWEEVNDDVRQALILFPHPARFPEGEAFDLRQKEIRTRLQKALDALDSEQLVTAETRNVHSVVISSYLKGYDRVSGLLTSSATVREFEEDEIEKHRAFVGDESLAVYLKDVSLEILTDRFESHVELADCQGSDAPNPLHLSMIQDYLASTHLIVYVVSTRTGIRQADIKFLSMIKKMGILDTTLFVANCDFNEHDTLANLKEVVEKIRNDIAVLRPDPPLFVLSALFNLFSSNAAVLSERDRMRMNQWSQEKGLVSFSEGETRRFESALFDLIHQDRSRLLLKNHVERLWLASSGIFGWMKIFEKGATQSAADVQRLIEKLEKHQERVEQIKSVIKTTLDGAVSKLKGELRSEIDRFFDRSGSGMANRTVKFIRDYEPPYDRYGNLMVNNGFSQALYRVFSDFKQSLDTFIAEAVNPEVIRFMKEAEAKMALRFTDMAAPYEAMVRDALDEYNRNMEALGISSSVEVPAGAVQVDMDWIRGVSAIRMPQNELALRYSAKIRSEAILHFGFFSTTRWIAKLLKRPVPDDKTQGMKALRKGVSRMKRELEQSIFLHFKDYRENLKFQYLFKLSEAAARYLLDMLVSRLQDYASTLTLLGRTIDGRQSDRSRSLEMIQSSKEAALAVQKRILSIRETVEGISP